ncbi:aminotransferase class-V domain-containing protein [Hirsutella rhossiliensis]|uniref:Aminotransferase class-V domain-containing protein n=1 Tax=Hirsutella rhossiliensis TaxID=111463 RepID=A0A9P8MZ95_9HYPO|nr:aminotransferase class-V domain-containing protein [Hirsutella rhossiliensis]KAH0963969.1 aminotransferase class-V domain-containing protein [Hirsutella rhossiliensis]
MSTIHDAYPEYVKTRGLDELRASEYSYLDEQGHVYLDYTGAGLAAHAQYRAHQARSLGTTYGNPHSLSPTSQSSTDMVELVRTRVLSHLNASPEEYAFIFTANATGAMRLVGESYPFRRGSRLVLTSDNHNSVNGLRMYAKRAHARTTYIRTRAPELRIDTATVAAALPRRRSRRFGSPRRSLFAYPAQSNFTGVRHPLSWVSLAQERGYDVLLDAAAYLPTGMLDLSSVKPEFVAISWYKLFGLPTGVGCLVALSRLNRPWFSGGTISAASVGVPWHAMAVNEAAFEDGTLNFLSIPDVKVGLDWLSSIGIDVIASRVRCLTGWFLDCLQSLQHSNGISMATVYGPNDLDHRGGTVSFNLVDATGNLIDERLVAMEAAAARFSIRTGCFCNPGAGEDAFGIDARTLKPLKQARTKSMEEFVRLVKLPSAGAVRVSFGVASIVDDVDFFIAFLKQTYRDRVTTTVGLPLRDGC